MCRPMSRAPVFPVISVVAMARGPRHLQSMQQCEVGKPPHLHVEPRIIRHARARGDHTVERWKDFEAIRLNQGRIDSGCRCMSPSHNRAVAPQLSQAARWLPEALPLVGSQHVAVRQLHEGVRVGEWAGGRKGSRPAWVAGAS